MNLELSICSRIGSMLCEARHNIAQEAIAAGADYLLWIDSDHVFPADALFRLLKHDKEIVGCAMSSRSTPRYVNCGLADSVERDSEELALAKWMSFGLVLIHRRVFEAIELPWFELEWTGAARPTSPPSEDVITFPKRICAYQGEDVVFFRKARCAGFDVWVDVPLSGQVGHIGTFIYTLDRAADAERIQQTLTDLEEG